MISRLYENADLFATGEELVAPVAIQAYDKMCRKVQGVQYEFARLMNANECVQFRSGMGVYAASTLRRYFFGPRLAVAQADAESVMRISLR